MTQRHSRVTSRVDIINESGTSVKEDLVNFESKIKGTTVPYKYPNVELKRCFDAAQFRRSNNQITQ